MFDLVWLVIGFLPATFFLWIAWYTGEDITVKGIIVYILGVVAGPITLALFIFFIFLLIDFNFRKFFTKDFFANILNKKMINGKKD